MLLTAVVSSAFSQRAASQTVVLSPTSLTFGSVAVGTTSAAKRITLTNSGSAALTITSIAASASYTETNTCGHSVAAKRSCVISVSFAPAKTGITSGKITITDNASNSPQTASLTGTGTTTGLLSIAVTPANPSVAAGATQQFTATGTFTGYTYNITDSVTWASTTPAVATISNSSGTQGLATAVATGSSTIKASSGRIVGSTLLTVTSPAIAITTYHYDNYRTGWNQNETILNATSVGSSSFGLLETVPLDNQVDAQPLVVPGVSITAGNDQGTHDVVYVVTENNTVYAIDAESGDILLSPNFGPPVMYPTGCVAPYDGINSTPVIDLSSNTLYVMVYTNQSTGPAYYLHALDLGSLSDKLAPVLVSASHLLTDGSTFEFNATYHRQRPALLLSNGTLYAAFGSFCNSTLSRGWLLGWQTATLDPLTAVGMTDTQATDPDNFFATSIWMSGYGPATDDSGNILYVTGNSDYSGTTYDGVTNIPNSVVKEAPDLSSVLDLFTPSNEASLDQGDRDFGSGGVLVLPDQPGTIPHLAVAAGKDGRMFLMNEDSLGGFSSHSNNVLGTYQIGKCWCGQSYYVDPTDLTARVVSSGGQAVEVWKLQSTPNPTLTMVTSGAVSSGQDPGFFTTISSSGTSNPIIWALARPLAANQSGMLYAFNPDAGGSTMSLLFEGPAGSWPIFNNNANLVPVVANGAVFVASYQQLQIFGLNSAKRKRIKK